MRYYPPLNQTLAAKRLGVTRLTVRRMLDDGRLDAVKKEGNYRGSWEISGESVERLRIKMKRIKRKSL